MIEELLHNKICNIVENAERQCFATRATELQVSAIEAIQKMKQEISARKKDAVAVANEDSANRLLSYEEALEALSYELKMWVALKTENASGAWDALVEAEAHASRAVRAHEVSQHLVGYLKRLAIIETTVFPPITFMSAGIIVEYSTCSICGGEYGDCNHVAGRVYMGQFCAREIRKGHMIESSIVLKPANKHCRITAFTDGGITRDTLTWRIIREESNGESRLAEAVISTP